MQEIIDTITSKIPSEWFHGEPEVSIDDDEILYIGRLDPSTDPAHFREASRAQRVEIAQSVERLYRRSVSWGVDIGDNRLLFTSQSTPVMTRLRMNERRVLDTLVKGGVARSRSEALQWCVKLVGQHESEWLADLQNVLEGVRKVRSEGPTVS
jgi:hypothetical protein